MNFQNELDALSSFLEILDRTGIAYAIGGSMASSVYGKVRFTEDADITIEPFSSIVMENLIQCLSSVFYVSRSAIQQAISMRTSFNVIHIATAFKIDCFVRNETPFQKRLLVRRKRVSIPGIAHQSVWAVCPEDILLLKLDWYHQGGCVSEKQWNDILGVLTIQKKSLNMADLKHWASELHLLSTLEVAIKEADAPR
jgi:hypothetical protein